ncbi:amino acid ABC transporter ATP-binding protein [Saccharopolyspora spinosa]|uniref:Polar amino acid transport system ATP-binding protein n=1 Tax=Saccharopolyspora spinosa TaxID=60894 RepID=A0A2N3Y0P3_SACSN|nr:amino acid ABC transporter ATP-binding protein [Saccharopolyspora spinosa]PKW16489.1 polar amino acid transport system ATP-binding protein [Saccharopolyspora spinosa]
MSPLPILEARKVSKTIKHNTILEDVSIEVQKGETVCLLGPSGAGKTTFLRCLNYLEKPSSGAILLEGELLGYRLAKNQNHLVELTQREVARQRRSIGMVFQSFNLFSHKTVLENVIEAPVGVLGRPKAEAIAEAQELLATVGMEHKANDMPDRLSGGQQQRVAIARALAMHPKVMLFDEPTSALDPELVREVLEAMKKLVELGMTMIVVTHEVGFAREVASRAVFMEAGRIVEDGPAREVLSVSQNPRTKMFLQQVL